MNVSRQHPVNAAQNTSQTNNAGSSSSSSSSSSSLSPKKEMEKICEPIHTDLNNFRVKEAATSILALQNQAANIPKFVYSRLFKTYVSFIGTVITDLIQTTEKVIAVAINIKEKGIKFECLENDYLNKYNYCFLECIQRGYIKAAIELSNKVGALTGKNSPLCNEYYNEQMGIFNTNIQPGGNVEEAKKASKKIENLTNTNPLNAEIVKLKQNFFQVLKNSPTNNLVAEQIALRIEGFTSGEKEFTSAKSLYISQLVNCYKYPNNNPDAQVLYDEIVRLDGSNNRAFKLTPDERRGIENIKIHDYVNVKRQIDKGLKQYNTTVRDFGVTHAAGQNKEGFSKVIDKNKVDCHSLNHGTAKMKVYGYLLQRHFHFQTNQTIQIEIIPGEGDLGKGNYHLMYNEITNFLERDYPFAQNIKIVHNANSDYRFNNGAFVLTMHPLNEAQKTLCRDLIRQGTPI